MQATATGGAVPAAAFSGAAAEVTEPRVRQPRPFRAPGKKVLAGHLGHEVITYLDAISNAQLICLAYGHIWPVLIPGRGRPRGWKPSLAGGRGGVFRIEEDCIRDDAGSCGTVRVSYTEDHGIFMPRGVSRQYRRDNDVWEVRPENSRITRLDVLDYITFRMAAELFSGIEPGEGALA